MALFFVTVFFLCLASSLWAEEQFLEKGMAEFRAENFEEALEFFVKAREQQPEAAIIPYYIGMIYKHMGNYGEAARYLTEAVNLSPPAKEAYLDLADTFYNLDEFKKAKEWIGRAEKEGIKPANTAFLNGLILIKEGDNKGAIAAFEKAKELDRSLEQTAVFQIGIAYSNERRLEEARDNFKAAVAIDPSTDLATYAKEYEDSIVRLLESHRTWRFNAGVSYQYDDNVLLKPSAAIPALEITGEEDNGIAALFRVDYSPLPAGPYFLNGQFYVNSNTYFKNSTHNLITQNISLMPGYMYKQAAITLPLAFMYVWLQEKEYMSYATARPTFSISFSGGSTSQLSLGYAKRKMLQPPLDPDEDRDADIYSASLSYVMPVSEDKGVLSMRYEFSRDITTGRNWDNTGHKVDLAVLMPLYNRLKLTMTGGAFLQDYKDIHSVFGVKRKDSTYTGAAIMALEVYKALSLNIQYSCTRAVSNIAVYDYNRNIFTIGLEFNF